METSTNISEWLEKLEQKYRKSGQNINAFLEGLYHSKSITYWDYIQLETLLSLQRPRTHFSDEPVFIMYHQVTELYFRMALREFEQLAETKAPKAEDIIKRVGRINRYFDCLTQSFAVMTDGMDVEQYLQFRMALTPASGFQSAQYRMIELSCTNIKHLVDKRFRAAISDQATVEELLDKIYWKAAGLDPHTGEKSLTLQIFEEKYLDHFIEHAKAYRNKNVWRKFVALPEEDKANPEVVQAMRTLDQKVNIQWPLAHYGAALRYLEGEPDDVEATGGSEWKKYLHPKYQKRIFFPELWSAEEIANWGSD